MTTTNSLNEPNTAPNTCLVEIPRFFERTAHTDDQAALAAENLEPGEAQFRKDFQARWWPGDMKTFTPPPKG